MSKAIVTVPVPDGLTSARYFEFDLNEMDLRVQHGTVLLVAPGEVMVSAFGPGQWSRLEFSNDE